ncbi:hypothetical protein ANN_10038 [Periplaneta americana]|uniref:Uncharacterized protein n=1 Tax=Periplaneta americana TaxID=6978 RepID=A0ABQ8TPG4_PERAM|nr:hypothetical protein ANN_10038 [Periplaneta americana]
MQRHVPTQYRRELSSRPKTMEWHRKFMDTGSVPWQKDSRLRNPSVEDIKCVLVLLMIRFSPERLFALFQSETSELPPIDAAQVVYVLWRRHTLSAEHSFNRIRIIHKVHHRLKEMISGVISNKKCIISGMETFHTRELQNNAYNWFRFDRLQNIRQGRATVRIFDFQPITPYVFQPVSNTRSVFTNYRKLLPDIFVCWANNNVDLIA